MAHGETWTAVVNGSMGKLGATMVDGKVYADVETLISMLGYSVAVNADGKVIVVQGGPVAKPILLEHQQADIPQSPSHPAPAAQDEFDAALQSLKDVGSAARIGMSPTDYQSLVAMSTALVDKCTANMGKDNPNVKNLRADLDVYLEAGGLWQQFIKHGKPAPFGNDTSYLSKGDDVVKPLLDKYPELKSELETFPFVGKKLGITKGLNFLWDKARVMVISTKRVQ
jgi:hypothetical protein